jgi:hypothetical protein
VGAGLHLLSQAWPETVAQVSLPVTTPCSVTSLSDPLVAAAPRADTSDCLPAGS